MRASSGFVVLIAGCVGACSSTDDEVGMTNAVDDAGASGPPRPWFDASVYGDGAPWNDPSRVALRQQVRGQVLNDDGTLATDQSRLVQTTISLRGVKVCVDGVDETRVPCVYTDENGWYELRGLPRQQPVVLKADLEGYQPAAQAVWTGLIDQESIDISTWSLLLVDYQPARAAGVSLEGGRGTVNFVVAGFDGVANTLVSGARVSIDDSSADGPYYFDAWLPVPGATSSLQNIGAFWNVPPGTHRITFEHDLLGCEFPGRFNEQASPAVWGFPTEQVNGVDVPVLAGRTTLVAGFCASPIPGADAAL